MNDGARPLARCYSTDEFPLGWEMAIKFGHRTILSVPLIREDRALGAILIRHTEVRQAHLPADATWSACPSRVRLDSMSLIQAFLD